ncbi:MAG TPA: MaoC/PaaZ C-terminal domain-containing protein [Acidimicrobiia bacterium]|nr:MaoC/PaaZ C-terminal domain-containing protein [Acidimicrobiia bacterium]
MPIDTTAVGAQSDSVEVSWSSEDGLLYALGVGAGADNPTDPVELVYTTENSLGTEQRLLPTFPVTVGIQAVRGVYGQIGPFDHAMLVHAEQTVTLPGRLPVEGQATLQATVTGIYDKGSGAVVATETTGVDRAGATLFTLGASVFIRGEGGWGGDRGPGRPADPPDRAPDHEVTYATRPDQALLYRLSGDRNPLHSDPRYAAKAGFPRPILHGLCTYGFTGRALLHALCEGDSDRFGTMSGRFSKPVLPGDRLTVSIWRLDDGAAFRTANQAGDTVIDAGRFAFRR